jgi:acyl-CoA thioester hydrolase
MPRAYTATFPIRFYECDPFDQLHAGNYLRLAAQAATEASAEAGYDWERYQALGAAWVIRAVQVDFLRPARVGQNLKVKTWVEDYRRVRSRRRFEFARDSDPQPLAQGFAEWVYVELSTGQPTRFPAEMMRVFFPEGLPPEAERRVRSTALPEAPRNAFTLRRRVAWHQLDGGGHLMNAWYLDWIGEATDNAHTYAGWPAERTDRLGFAFVMRQARLEFLAPAYLEDEVLITTYLAEPLESQVIRYYQFRRQNQRGSNEVMASARVVWESVDLETEQPRPLPDDWVADLSPQITEWPEDDEPADSPANFAD